MSDRMLLKEKQRLQQREKELERREAAVTGRVDQLDNELKAKSEKLEQAHGGTAALLRRASEEREAALREACTAAATLAQRLKAAAAGAADASALKQAAEEAGSARIELATAAENLERSDLALRESQAALSGEVAAAKAALDKEQRAAAELEARHTSARAAEAAMKEVLAHALARFLRLLARLREAREAAAAAERAAQELRELRDKDQAPITARAAALRRSMVRLEAECRAEGKAKEALDAQVADLEEECRAKARALTALEQAHRAGAASLEALEAEFAAAKQEVEAASRGAEALRSELDACRAELDRHRAAISRLRASLDERQRWIEALETSTRTYKKRNAELWAQLRGLPVHGDDQSGFVAVADEAPSPNPTGEAGVEGSGKLGGKGEGAALAARRGKPRSAAPCVELEWQDAYALRVELEQKKAQVKDMEAEIRMLRDMVKARESDARAMEVKNEQLRRKLGQAK
ncbi:hypothetical protein EMIHUDRAFT_223589 [Emiliania huxleyi CCMP1516]|uniref:Uncharacterized protein n=2 Tax=Emiliania huxleyi TaxID=2903 RepID=A0A0D3KUE4_EMIH1|nr:hypothetical protein EMIHUDRAFT_223589 [Emiliania huxleyi CCMP1516]EOD39379.1 hypothetical protein EMIHUDRAFT_223589 [Emiliania huxleyi CCMP1516]|eukprot:XP_005791808.1 hypothetical protein EMIHUDRAFT_223589 [Emiliania huxleyi CCMP1516]